MKLKTVKREDARVYGLPCRDCMHYIGPQINRAKNITFGLHHQTVSHGPDTLEMVTSFSPSVVPGSHEEDD